MKTIYTTDPVKGKVKAGHIIDGVFYKHVSRQRHLLRIATAYAIQADVYEKIKESCDAVIIEESDTGDKYSSMMSYWDGMGSWWEHNHGKQRILSVKYMQKITT